MLLGAGDFFKKTKTPRYFPLTIKNIIWNISLFFLKCTQNGDEETEIGLDIDTLIHQAINKQKELESFLSTWKHLVFRQL